MKDKWLTSVEEATEFLRIEGRRLGRRQLLRKVIGWSILGGTAGAGLVFIKDQSGNVDYPHLLKPLEMPPGDPTSRVTFLSIFDSTFALLEKAERVGPATSVPGYRFGYSKAGSFAVPIGYASELPTLYVLTKGRQNGELVRNLAVTSESESEIKKIEFELNDPFVPTLKVKINSGTTNEFPIEKDGWGQFSEQLIEDFNDYAQRHNREFLSRP